MALTDDHLGVESLTIAVEPRAPIEGPSSDLEEVIVRVNGATVLPLEETFADGSVLELTHNPDLSYSFSDSIAEINEGDAIPGLSDGEGTVEVAFQDASLPFPTGGDARASRLERVHHGLERSSAVGAIECLCAPGAPLQGSNVIAATTWPRKHPSGCAYSAPVIGEQIPPDYKRKSLSLRHCRKLMGSGARFRELGPRRNE